MTSPNKYTPHHAPLYWSWTKPHFTRQKYAATGGYRSKVSSYIWLIIAYILVFTLFMVVNPFKAHADTDSIIVLPGEPTIIVTPACTWVETCEGCFVCL